MRALKAQLQTALQRIGFYQRLKASFIYDLYWSLADRRIVENRSGEVEFYRSVLKGFQKGGRIFDVGANHGYKTDIFLRLGATVVAVEPDEKNQDILREKFLSYRAHKKQVVIIGKALGSKTGTDTMWIDAPGSAKNTLSKKWVETLRMDERRFGHVLEFRQEKNVETTTLDELIAKYGCPFFVKIDVEGYEPNVLRGMRQPVPYLSFEVNLPEFRLEGMECVDLLGHLAMNGTFNYVVDCQKGLVLEQWCDAREFSQVLSTCTEKSVEVFWRTPVGSDKS